MKLQNIQTAHVGLCQKIKKNTMKKCTDDLNRHFSKEVIHMSKRHMKRCSISSWDVNQNNTEVALHAGENGHQKIYKQ